MSDASEPMELDDDGGWDDNDGGWGDAEDGDWEEGGPVPQVPTADQEAPLARQLSFVILNQDELHRRRRQLLGKVSEMLSLSHEESQILLLYYKWKSQKLIETYFDDPANIRVAAGLDPANTVKPVTSGTLECPQCFDDVDASSAFCLKCGHQSCTGCWTEYLSEAAKARDAVNTTCNFQCNLRVPEAIWQRFASPSDYKRYLRFLLASFVAGSRNLVFCPAPGCELACEYTQGGAKEILCACGFYFCFKCGEESHRPSSCADAGQWRIKANSESENITWIMANTKTCAKCSVQIEKNQGCNHMTCRQCGHEFCWLCKGLWKDHGSATGGYYRCNRYEDNKKEGKLSDEDKAADDAKNELQRYMHYFQRFDNHDKSMTIAKNALETTEQKMKDLQDLRGGGFNDVQFLQNGVLTVIECRRLLKWTYVVGYYLRPGPERNLFEMLQEDLEKYTEHLHELTERDLSELSSDKMRSDINNYTRVTGKFRDNLMDGIEGGLTSSAAQ